MVMTRNRAYLEFARRLAKALDAMESKGCPRQRGRAAWVQRRYDVSNEAARKWLNGMTMPDQANLARIAEDTGFSVDWLQSGNGSPRASRVDDAMTEQHRARWHSLTDTQKFLVLSYADHIAGLDVPPDNPPPLGPVKLTKN